VKEIRVANDIYGVATWRWLDHGTAERMLNGSLTDEDAPPGYAEVNKLLRRARVEVAVEELSREAATISSMQTVMLRHTISTDSPGGKTAATRVRAATVTAVAAAVVLGVAGAAAAAGSLPGPLQSTAKDVLGVLGISVPGPTSEPTGITSDAHAPAGGEQTDTSDQQKLQGVGGTTSSSNGVVFGHCSAQNAANTQLRSTSLTSTSCGTTSDLAPPTPGPEAHFTGPPTSVPAGPPASTPASGTAPVTTPNLGSARTSSPGSGGPSGIDNGSSGIDNGSTHSSGANGVGDTASSAGASNHVDRGQP
jgi:hypothetical protein